MTKTLMKAFLITSGVIAALVLALVLGLDGYVKTDHGQRLVLEAINRSIPGTLICRQLNISLLNGQVELFEGVLTDPEGKQVVRVAGLTANLSWSSLLRGDVVIEEADIVTPVVDLGLESEGNLRIVRAVYRPGTDETPGQGEGGGFPLNVVVEDLSLTDGTVHYENMDGSVHAELLGVQIAGDGNLAAQTVNFEGQVACARYAGADIHAELQKFLARTSFRKDAFDPVVIQAETGVSRVSLKGSVKAVSEKPQFNLVADVVLSLPELRESLGLAPELTGEVTASISAQGTLEDPTIGVHLNYGGGMLAGGPVDAADLDMRLTDQILILDTAHIALASGDIFAQGSADLKAAFPGGFFSGKRDLEALTYSLSANGRGIELGKLVPDELSLAGKVAGLITLSGRGVSPERLSAEISVDIGCQGLKSGGTILPADTRLRAVAGIEEGTVRVETLEVISGKNTLKASGSVNMIAEELAGLVEVDLPDLKRDLQPLGIDGTGNFGLNARVSGTFARPALTATFKGKELELEDITLGDLTGSAELDRGGTLKITEIVLQNRGSGIRGTGTVKLYEKFPEFLPDAPLRIAATLSSVKVSDFITEVDTAGTLSGELSIGGTVRAPHARMALVGKNLSAGDVRIGDVQVSSRYERGTILVEQALVQNRNSSLAITGSVRVFDHEAGRVVEDPDISIRVEGEPVFLEDVTGIFKGKITVAASVEGSVRKPGGSVIIAAQDMDLGFQKIRDLRFAAGIEGNRLLVKTLKVVVAGEETITGTGWVSLEGAYEFSLASEGIALAGIDALRVHQITRGSARFTLSGHGTFTRPVLIGELLLADVSVNEEDLGDVRITLELKDNLATISGRQGFDFSAAYHLDSRDFTASVTFDDTDLVPYFQIARYPDLTGTVTGKLEARGNARDSGGLQASLDLARLAVFFKGGEIIRGKGLRATLAGGQFSVEGLHLVLAEQGWVNIDGTGMLDGAVSLEADGRIPLQVLEPFMEDLSDFAGAVALSARLKGTYARPSLSAAVDLQGVGFMTPYNEQKIHDVTGRITITQDTLRIETITGMIGTGRFDLAGSMELKQFSPEQLDLVLKAKSLPVSVPDTLDLVADLELRARGTRDKSSIQGQVVLLEGTYYRDVKLNLFKEIVERKPPSRAPREQITMPFLRNMSLDISIKRRNPLFVDNNLAQLDINPDLLIRGSVNNPIVSGRASIESGTVEFRNRVFTVTRGVIDFLNPYETEATLDIESEVKVRDWMIYLGISGTPENLNLKLRSDPPEEDNDILSLLVIGKTSRGLMAGEGGQTQSTSSMIAALAASRYGEDIREATGLDIFEVESGAVEEDSADAVKITIGKELSRRMTLKYAMESKKSELSQRAIAEYKLLENFVLNGFQDTRGIFGAEMQFTLEFR